MRRPRRKATPTLMKQRVILRHVVPTPAFAGRPQELTILSEALGEPAQADLPIGMPAMSRVPMPSNEAVRLAKLRELDILDSPPDDQFDALARTASLVCGTPISLISLIDEPYYTLAQ